MTVMNEEQIIREKPFTAAQIIGKANIHHLKTRNIYLYGSRIYGTNRIDSDFDIILIGAALNEHSEIEAEIDNSRLNIHIITPDKFKRDLENHDIMNLECFFSPGWARIQEKEILKFTLNKKKLSKNIIAQSFNSWQGGKYKLNEGDIYRGLKSVFHSLKMLIFAIQIMEHGKIMDFTAANYLHKEINDCDEIDWEYFREKYLPFKIELEKKLKSLS
jgi:predicted nucleotidyltransferase